MKADVLLKYHEILTQRGAAAASLYFALQFEGSEWREDEVLPEKADYLTRSKYEAEQKSRQREGMLLAGQYFGQALAAEESVVKVRALAGRWRTMKWLAKEYFDQWGHCNDNDNRRRITGEINAAAEWRIGLRAIGFPKEGYWPRRIFEKGVEGSVLEAERWHFERILAFGHRRYRDQLTRFSDRGAVLWALGVIAELGLDGEPDPERAIELYEKALAKKCSWASWRLGDMLAAMGRLQEARASYEAGAGMGHPLAEYKLAILNDGETPSSASVELLVSAARAGVGDAWYVLRNFLSARDAEPDVSEAEIDTMRTFSVALHSSKAIREALKLEEEPGKDYYQHNREVNRLWGALAKSLDAQDCYDAAYYYLTSRGMDENPLYNLFLRAARLGSAEAQYHLGRFHDPAVSSQGYSYERNAETSYKEKNLLTAFMWYEKAASNGSADARYLLAIYYKEGCFVSRDERRCHDLTLLAAESKHRRAMLAIADYAKKGFGCEKDVHLAIKYYKEILARPVGDESDKEGRSIAQTAALELARIYDHDLAEGPHAAEAFEYYSLAANTYDDAEAHRWLSEWYEGVGDVCDINKSAEHLAKYLCIKWDRFGDCISTRVNRHKVYHNHKSVVVEEMSAEVARCVEIAYAYETGIQVHHYYPKSGWEQVLESDAVEAFKWYSRAYEMGALSAGLRCAEMLTSGIGSGQDVSRAYNIYVGLASNDMIEACLALARMYSSGLLVESDDSHCALYWLLKASDIGDEEARYLIGLEYEKPTYEGRDKSKAITWFKLSRCEEAYLRLARCYRDGDGVLEDRKVAAQYYRLCSSISARIEFADMCVDQGGRLWNDEQTRGAAFRWFLRAARLKNTKGQLKVAALYLHGDVVGVSPANAACWNYWAAECEDSEGQWRFGAQCELGIGVEQSMETALSYYEKASNQGHPLAKLRLAELGRLPLESVDDVASKGIPEAFYIRAMIVLRAIGNGDPSARSLQEVQLDLATAAKGGVVEALYNDELDALLNRQCSEKEVVKAMEKGCSAALLRWARMKIDQGCPDEVIHRLWDVYAEGYRDAASLIRDAYTAICKNRHSGDMYVDTLRDSEISRYMTARLASLEWVHDKGDLSILLKSFISSKNDAVIIAKRGKFNMKFNSYRETPQAPYYPEHDDYDDYDDCSPRTFEDAYEIYGSKLWDA